MRLAGGVEAKDVVGGSGDTGGDSGGRVARMCAKMLKGGDAVGAEEGLILSRERSIGERDIVGAVTLECGWEVCKRNDEVV